MLDGDLIDLVLMASPVVQAVMLILFIMSVSVWAVAISKSYQIRKAQQHALAFSTTFWNTQELTTLFNVVSNQQTKTGLEHVFESGFREFVRLKKQGVVHTADLMAATQRAMKIAFSKESDRLDNRLSLLATVGSSAPYIGLFGTVWGIMHAFQSLGNVQHATLAAVAPGISEALLATAIGLFAAIPAVIAYNRLANKVDRLLSEYENFSESLLTIMQRQAHSLDTQPSVNSASDTV